MSGGDVRLFDEALITNHGELAQRGVKKMRGDVADFPCRREGLEIPLSGVNARRRSMSFASTRLRREAQRVGSVPEIRLDIADVHGKRVLESVCVLADVEKRGRWSELRTAQMDYL